MVYINVDIYLLEYRMYSEMIVKCVKHKENTLTGVQVSVACCLNIVQCVNTILINYSDFEIRHVYNESGPDLE